MEKLGFVQALIKFPIRLRLRFTITANNNDINIRIQKAVFPVRKCLASPMKKSLVCFLVLTGDDISRSTSFGVKSKGLLAVVGVLEGATAVTFFSWTMVWVEVPAESWVMRFFRNLRSNGLPCWPVIVDIPTIRKNKV